MAPIREIFEKAGRKIRARTVAHARRQAFYLYLYPSYWRLKLRASTANSDGPVQYYTAIPNRGAGIGHQFANWVAGYWFARAFGLRFAHVPFSDPKWERFFGFGEGEVAADDLLRHRDYRFVRLPKFDEGRPDEVTLIEDIVGAYGGERVVFLAEQDQFLRDHYKVMPDLQRKFDNSDSRSAQAIEFNPERLSIALHMRRGDIMGAGADKDPSLMMRRQTDDYFKNVLVHVLAEIGARDFEVLIFSQGKSEDFAEFQAMPNVKLCLDMDPMRSVLHMTAADVLITSKSSFSYQPALLNRGVKVCPAAFWHGYPDAPDWILTEPDGTFDRDRLRRALELVKTSRAVR